MFEAYACLVANKKKKHASSVQYWLLLYYYQSTVSIACLYFSYRVLYLTGPAFLITLSLATFEGIVAYAYYSTIGCDPLTSKQIKNPNQVYTRTEEHCFT